MEMASLRNSSMKLPVFRADMVSRRPSSLCPSVLTLPSNGGRPVSLSFPFKKTKSGGKIHVLKDVDNGITEEAPSPGQLEDPKVSLLKNACHLVLLDCLKIGTKYGTISDAQAETTEQFIQEVMKRIVSVDDLIAFLNEAKEANPGDDRLAIRVLLTMMIDCCALVKTP